jgi:Flp pilus assembly protein TadG
MSAMKSRKKQSGQAMLESALILLVFLVVLLAIVDFGQFFYFHQSLTDRARAGARYGSVHACTVLPACSEAVNYTIYNDPTGAGTALLPCLAGECTSNATVTAVVTAPSAGSNDTRITVSITNYPFNFILPYFQKSVWTISATAPYEFAF